MLQIINHHDLTLQIHAIIFGKFRKLVMNVYVIHFREKTKTLNFQAWFFNMVIHKLIYKMRVNNTYL